jgi:hypothetical protein
MRVLVVFYGRHKIRIILVPRILYHLRVKMHMIGRYTSDICNQRIRKITIYAGNIGTELAHFNE